MAPSSIRRIAIVLVVVVDVNHRSAESLVSVSTTPCEGGRLHRRLRIPERIKKTTSSATLFNKNSDLVDEGGGIIRKSVDRNNNIIRPYIRIQKRGRHYDVQTAITTFRRGGLVNDMTTTTTVDLHAQIHFADASYYNYFNDVGFASRYDRVLYELIVEERFLEASSTIPGGCRQLSSSPMGVNPIAPTPMDQNIALQYGLQCQVDGIHYCQDGWIHADLTREEFMSQLYHGKDNNRLEIMEAEGEEEEETNNRNDDIGVAVAAAAVHQQHKTQQSTKITINTKMIKHRSTVQATFAAKAKQSHWAAMFSTCSYVGG
jgi:hypothetical protein